MRRLIITEHFDRPKTSGLWLVVEHFYDLEQILAANFLQGHICVLEREFWQLDPYCRKTTPQKTFQSVVFSYIIYGLLSPT